MELWRFTYWKQICTNCCSLCYRLTRKLHTVMFQGYIIGVITYRCFKKSHLTNYYPPFSSKVRLGEHDTKHDGPDCQEKTCNLGVQDFDIGKVIVHEQYNKPVLYRNDIALIKLNGQVSQNGKLYHKLHNTKK